LAADETSERASNVDPPSRKDIAALA